MLSLLLAALPASPPQDPGTPRLHRTVEVPASLRHTDGYGGDVRMGDLDGDGQVDFVVHRAAAGGMKPCFLGAFDGEGRALWQQGSGGIQPARPGPVAVYDLDGDGADEVLCLFVEDPGAGGPHHMSDAEIQVRSGRTGEVRRRAAPRALTARRGEGANWVHQRILVANLRGTDRPRDLVIKLGDTVVAFDDELEVLWTYRIEWNDYGRCSAYIPAVGDVDGDGRDEVNGGYYLLGPDGTPRWERALGRHMDSVAIAPWDDGTVRAICSGHGHVVAAGGGVVLALGPDLVPHGQEVRVADFLAAHPGPEMALRWNGHAPDVLVAGTGGTVLERFTLNDSPNHTGMEAVFWNGPDEPALLYNGGMLWRGDGTEHARLPDLPAPTGPPRMGWYHCIPADVCGDGREEVVVYDPWDHHVRIYTPAPFDAAAFTGYVAGPRQYNVRLMD